MENRQNEIRECRAEAQELMRRVVALSARIDRLSMEEAYGVEKHPAVPAEPEEKTTAEKTPAENTPELRNLENTVGKNLFAVLASVLVLLGVGVFISTIYEYIPEFVKIIAIYVFGFALLGGGLMIYSRNKNNFWLGVATCGLAELLVSIITSHSYFEVLSLPATFALVLVWIIGSFYLTKFQPTVFKTIGYIGFIISMLLGLSLLTDHDTAIYLTLVASYGVLAVFFMVTNPAHKTMNTVLAFASVGFLCMFLNMRAYLPETMSWLFGVIPGVILVVFHGVYLLRAGLHRNAYPFYSVVTLVVQLMYLTEYRVQVILPLTLLLVFGLWLVNYKLAPQKEYRVCYTLCGAMILFGVCMAAADILWQNFLWFAGAAAAAYVLYGFTRKRDVAWIGLVCFVLFYIFAGMQEDVVRIGAFIGALGFFGLSCSKLLRRDNALETAWYVLLFVMAFYLEDLVLESIGRGTGNFRQMRELCHGVFYMMLTVVNTVYLHISTADQARVMRVGGNGVVLLILQGGLLVNCLMLVDSGNWLVALLGVAGSMLILAHSLHYTYKTGGTDRKLMVWQFVKFSLYCWFILAQLNSPDILLNIALLLIAILAIVLGFRLGHKSVRMYGLVLSLLDVVCLVLFNIDFSNSLQLAGGIVLCGALCFVISFIYSRISRSAVLTKRQPEENGTE